MVPCTDPLLRACLTLLMAPDSTVPPLPPSALPPGARPVYAHLCAALIVVILAALALAGFNLYTDSLAQQYIHAAAPLELKQTDPGLAWQRAAFRAPDLLPIYGSSELDHQAYEGSFHGSIFFKDYPTGFTIFPVGKPGNTCLVILQDLAALQDDLRGKKVVISISPPWFIRPGAGLVRADAYANNFSALHAYSFVFDSNLSDDLKAHTAQRMLAYPATYERDAFLAFALNQTAAGTPLARALLLAITPIGKLTRFVLEMQDKFETILAVLEHPEWQTRVEHQPAAIDWQVVFDRADGQAERGANNNPYGFYNYFWKTRADSVMDVKARRRVEEFVNTIKKSPDWTDCDLLLRAVREMGADPLVLSQPIKGKYFHDIGVDYQARSVFYKRQQDLVAKYQMPFIDFANHDDDLLFVVDPYSHLSPKGWAYYDHALDAFYHNQPLGQ